MYEGNKQFIEFIEKLPSPPQDPKTGICFTKSGKNYTYPFKKIFMNCIENCEKYKFDDLISKLFLYHSSFETSHKTNLFVKFMISKRYFDISYKYIPFKIQFWRFYSGKFKKQIIELLMINDKKHTVNGFNRISKDVLIYSIFQFFSKDHFSKRKKKRSWARFTNLF